MKLLRVKVRNLNSLYGEHEVDLEGRLGGAPLFLIQGPTGAGKSTLMDAIALALFGQTPRLPVAKTKTDLDADCRNIMSRGTGEALAEVELSKIEGGRTVRYRVAWSCRRSHGRADGTLQDPRRLLERREGGGEWVTLADDSREKFYRPEFDKMLEGMSVEDFQRSVLLAQGEFAAFLRASEDERASILERLTDTGFYKELGARAADRRRAAEAEREKARAALGGIVLMSEADEEAVRNELQTLRQEDKAARQEMDQLMLLLQWLEETERLSQSAAAAAAQVEAAEAEARTAATELADLAEHERCAPAKQVLLDYQRAQSAVKALAEALPQRHAHAAACKEGLKSCQEVAKQAEAAAEDAVRVLGEADPLLKQARVLRTALAGARAELDRAQKTRAARKAASDEAQAAQAREQKAFTEAEEARLRAEASLEPLGWAKPLVEALTGLRAQHVALQAGREGVAQKTARHDQARQSLAAARTELDGLASRQTTLQTQADAVAERLRQSEEGLSALLEGAATVAVRRATLQSQLQRQAERLQAFGEVERLLRERDALAAACRTDEAALSAIQTDHAACAQKVGALKAQLEAASARVVAVRTELEDQRWMLGLADERQRLHTDRECPLCGGTDHPWVREGRWAEVDARVRKRCAALAEEHSQLEEGLKLLQQQLGDEERAEATARVRLSSLQSGLQVQREASRRCDDALATAGAACGLERPSREALVAARSALSSETARTRGAMQALEDADAQAQAARQAALAARAELDRSAATREARERAVADGEVALAALEQELTEERARLDALEQSLCAALTQLGVSCAEGIDAALHRAAEGVAQWRKADEALRVAMERASATGARLQQAAVRVEAAVQSLGEAAREATAREAAVAELLPQANEALGGEDPDVVEARLQQALQTATQKVKTHAAELKRLEAEVARAESECASKEAALAEARRVEAEAHAALESALRKLRLPDASTLRARLLPDDRVEALGQTRLRLDRALERAKAILQATNDAVRRHEAARPAALQQGDEVPVEAMKQRLGEMEKALEVRMHKEGGLNEKLERQSRARADHRERQKIVDAAEESLAVWDRLHGLIGVRDGDAFKRFAQTLNLAELMDRANHHLERLAPRYSLVGATHPTGEPRLAFAIRDAFQADQVRPISTLSGGETFLVSLALALALAGYRTVKMPIETLLLDEGFGTLDPQTLQVAMNALEALHATGTQVGIITHVEALKERIPARVLVERCGNGRSTVRVESA